MYGWGRRIDSLRLLARICPRVPLAMLSHRLHCHSFCTVYSHRHLFHQGRGHGGQSARARSCALCCSGVAQHCVVAHGRGEFILVVRVDPILGPAAVFDLFLLLVLQLAL